MKFAGILYERHLSQLIQRKKNQHKINMKNKYFIFHPKKRGRKSIHIFSRISQNNQEPIKIEWNIKLLSMWNFGKWAREGPFRNKIANLMAFQKPIKINILDEKNKKIKSSNLDIPNFVKNSDSYRLWMESSWWIH